MESKKHFPICQVHKLLNDCMKAINHDGTWEGRVTKFEILLMISKDFVTSVEDCLEDAKQNAKKLSEVSNA